MRVSQGGGVADSSDAILLMGSPLLDSEWLQRRARNGNFNSASIRGLHGNQTYEKGKNRIVNYDHMEVGNMLQAEGSEPP